MEEIIEQYLLGQLSKEEKAAFEQRINTEPNLAKDVKIQRELMEAIKIQGLKADISNAYRQMKLGKMLKNAVITTLIAAVVGLGIYYIAKSVSQNNEPQTTGATLPSNDFTIDNTRDTVIETAGGIILHIPANAFGDIDNYELEVKEALNALDIMEAGLSTMSDSNLLATAGMFKITATKDGKELQLADGKEITAQVPTDEVDPDIMLFDGVEDSTGKVNWVNPTKINKHLITRSFDELNFYPPDYLAKVAENGYDASNKQFTDSLYWSFDCGVGSVAEGLYSNLEGSYYETDATSRVQNFDLRLDDSSTLTPQLWKITLKPAQFQVGDIVTLQIMSDQIKDGWIYANGMSGGCWRNITLETTVSDSYKRIGELRPQFVEEVYDAQMGCATFRFGKRAILTQRIQILKQNFEFTGSLVYQRCNTKGKWVLFERIILLKGFPNQADTGVAEEVADTKQICPASIQALQTKRFEKTYIATKEFEQRLQHLFEVCDEASLNVYIQNLDKDISYADSIVALRIEGSKKDIFQRFAAQKLGNTKSASPAFAKLAAYHKKKKNAYDDAARKARKKVLSKYAKADADKQNRDTEKVTSEIKDRANVYQKELKTNLKEAYRQAGLPYPTPLPPKGTYTLTLDRTGWNNLDYVIESTSTRTSLKTTFNGKDISIEYHVLNVEVLEEETYDFVNVYLIPNKLPSYQKLKKKEETYFESLNELFDYELVCLAKKGSDYYVYTDLLQKKDASKTVSLKSIDKRELQKLLKSTNKSTANRNVAEDLKYEEQNFLYNRHLEKRKKDEDFRREIEGVIWPCSQTSAAPSAVLQDGDLY